MNMETIIIITGIIMFTAGVYAGRNWKKLTEE